MEVLVAESSSGQGKKPVEMLFMIGVVVVGLMLVILKLAGAF